MDFGFYPCNLNLADTLYSIKSLPNRELCAQNVISHNAVIDGWYYASLIERSSQSGKMASPPGRIFDLPKTHTITVIYPLNEEDVKFIIWWLSFFLGFRLTTDVYGFLDATPVKRRKVNDFVIDHRSIKAGLDLVIDFIDKHRADKSSLKRVEAIINALFMAQNPQNLCFERFQYLYMALDACYRQAYSAFCPGKKDIKHDGRIEWLCKQFNILPPTWIKKQGKCSKSLLASIRNDAIHEALFFNEPLGFSVFGGNNQPDNEGIILQMENIVSRVLVALIGKPSAQYVSTPYDTRQFVPIDLI